MPQIQEQTKGQVKKRFPSRAFLAGVLGLIGSALLMCVSTTYSSISEARINWLDDLRAIENFDGEIQPQANSPEYRHHLDEVRSREKQAEDKLQAAIQAAYARQTLLLIATAGLLVVASLVILLFNFKLGNRGQPAEPLG